MDRPCMMPILGTYSLCVLPYMHKGPHSPIDATETRSQAYKRRVIYDVAHDLVSLGENTLYAECSPTYSQSMERLFKHLVKLCKEFEDV